MVVDIKKMFTNFLLFILLLVPSLAAVGQTKTFHKKHHKTLNCPQKETPQAAAAQAPPLVFADTRLATIYPIIQKFKSIITSDPLNVTKTWVGSGICKYRGFYCDNPPYNKSATVVASIDFNGFQLAAPTLDGFIDQLLDIALFHANSNYFSGSLPLNIPKLPFLYELDLSNNLLTGPFPSAVLAMDGLTFLDLRFNSFVGSVPPQIFTENLDALFINNNDLTLTFPDNIGSSRIRYLTLANNKFNGPLTGGIFKVLTSLTEVVLLNSELTGCIPYEIGSLNEAIVLDASNNELTGMQWRPSLRNFEKLQIFDFFQKPYNFLYISPPSCKILGSATAGMLPFSLACLEKVEQLSFAGNLLFGMVPDVMCTLPNLVNLRLSDNYFIGVGPLCMVLIRRGVVDVRNNCIPGVPMQRSVRECAEFFAQQRYSCPRMWSYSFIPCKPSQFYYSLQQLSPPSH